MKKASELIKLVIISLVPNELGRALYKVTFRIYSKLCQRGLDNDVSIWIRNSLLQSYFRFGYSDIDVSVSLVSNKHLFQKAQKISSVLSLCPLIKEINFYSPYLLEFLPRLGNQFELQRDPVLWQQLSNKLTYDYFEKAQKFTYLMRMFFSNLVIKGQYPQTDRLNQKWNFHFELCGFSSMKPLLLELKNDNDLLKLIFDQFSDLNPNHLNALEKTLLAYQNQISPHIQLQNMDSSKDFVTLLPHYFCFCETPLKEATAFEEQIFISQLSWEVVGMLSQPMLFQNDKLSIKHLFHIHSLLSKSSFTDKHCEESRFELLNAIEGYLELLGSHFDF